MENYMSEKQAQDFQKLFEQLLQSHLSIIDSLRRIEMYLKYK